MTSKRKWILSVLAMLAIAAGGCDSDKTVGASDVDADTDTDTDADTDSDTDTDTDTDSDTDTDADTDTDSDTDADTDTDTETDTDTDTGPVPLTLTGVVPQAASREENTDLAVVGTGFVEGLTVSLHEPLSDTTVDLGTATVALDGASGTTTLLADATLPVGFYDVTVTNPGLEFATLVSALYISSLSSPQVTLVEPPLAWAGVTGDDVLSDRTVQIKGEGFVNTPWVRWVSVADPDQSYDALEVHFLDAATIEAVIPSESAAMPPGEYHVWVINPDGLSGQWIDTDTAEPGIFVVTSTPPPSISALDPVQWPFMDELNPLTVYGSYFQDGATIAFVTPTGDQELGTVAFVDSTQLTAVIPGSTFDVGLYPVRVTNPDGQWDLFYAFESKNGTDGHFDDQTFTVLTESPMTAGRQRLAVDFAFDNFGGTHLYASGGVDAEGTVRGDVESVSINIYGDLGQWRTQTQWGSLDTPRVSNTFNTPRQGHNLVRAGEWLFAIGGTAGDTTDVLDNTILALDTVEHARVLGLDTRPEPTPPVPQTGGVLPLGTWYYRVSAIGTWGESLASKQVQIINSAGAFQICWDSVADATAYNIYRSPAADGRPGTTRLLAAEQTGLCFVDDGSNAPAPGFAAGNPDSTGSLPEGIWTYRLTAVVGATESVAGYRSAVELETGDTAATLTWQPVAGATYNIYRTLAVATEIDGNEETYLLASGIDALTWTDDGTLTPDDTVPAPDGVAVLPPGTLGRWEELTGTLNSPREGAGAVAILVPSGDIALDDSTYIYVGGGRPHGGGDAYYTTLERALVLANGDLDLWTTETYEFNTARAFFPLITSASRTETFVPGDPHLDKGGKSLMEEQIYLFAIAGDDLFAGASNSGIVSIEAAAITAGDGSLESWYLQTADLPAGRRTYGHDAVIVDDFMYCFTGVDMEQIAAEPTPLISNTSRFPINIPPATDVTLIDPYMAANAQFSVARSYYDLARVNGFVYLVGGNDGSGAIDSVESIPQ